jgi:hypothetical protein
VPARIKVIRSSKLASVANDLPKVAGGIGEFLRGVYPERSEWAQDDKVV